MFEQITLLLSFVYALALTHLLASMTELIAARKRVQFFAPQALWMLIPVLVLFNNWIQMHSLSEVSHWTLPAEAMEFAQAISLYFLCSLVAVRVAPNGPVDMKALHLAQRPAFLAAATAGNTLVMIGNFLDRLPNSNDWIVQVSLNLPALGFFALGAVARKPWQYWLAPLGTLSLIVAFFAMLPPTGCGPCPLRSVTIAIPS